MSLFRDHVAIVIGAGSGIGRAIALGLGEHGAVVCLVGRTRAKLNPSRAEILVLSAGEIVEGPIQEVPVEELDRLYRSSGPGRSCSSTRAPASAPPQREPVLRHATRASRVRRRAPGRGQPGRDPCPDGVLGPDCDPSAGDAVRGEAIGLPARAPAAAPGRRLSRLEHSGLAADRRGDRYQHTTAGEIVLTRPGGVRRNLAAVGRF